MEQKKKKNSHSHPPTHTQGKAGEGKTRGAHAHWARARARGGASGMQTGTAGWPGTAYRRTGQGEGKAPTQEMSGKRCSGRLEEGRVEEKPSRKSHQLSEKVEECAGAVMTVLAHPQRRLGGGASSTRKGREEVRKRTRANVSSRRPG